MPEENATTLAAVLRREAGYRPETERIRPSEAEMSGSSLSKAQLSTGGLAAETSRVLR